MNIGVIGLGKIAEKHINAYKKLDDLEIFVNDKDKTKEKLARTYGVKWVEHQRDIINDDSINAIDVSVPTEHHYEIISKALEHGKHVFCEKPLTLNLGEAQDIKEKAKKLNKLVIVGYLYRFHPGFQLLKKVVEEDIIGEPYYAIFRLGGRGSHKIWKHKRGKGGGVVGEMLVHMLDLIMWYFDKVKRIDVLHKEVLLKKRNIENKLRRVDADDVILLKIENNKMKIVCQCDLVSPSYMNYVEIHGTNGSVCTSILDFFPTVLYCKEPKGIYDRGHNFFNFPKVDLFYEELKFFLDSVRKNGDENKTDSIDQSIEMLKLLEKASLLYEF